MNGYAQSSQLVTRKISFSSKGRTHLASVLTQPGGHGLQAEMKWNLEWDDMSFLEKHFKESWLIQACGTLLRSECTSCAEGRGCGLGVGQSKGRSVRRPQSPRLEVVQLKRLLATRIRGH
jgi:hypothetical protein